MWMVGWDAPLAICARSWQMVSVTPGFLHAVMRREHYPRRRVWGGSQCRNAVSKGCAIDSMVQSLVFSIQQGLGARMCNVWLPSFTLTASRERSLGLIGNVFCRSRARAVESPPSTFFQVRGWVVTVCCSIVMFNECAVHRTHV